jgi:hypothetical protein
MKHAFRARLQPVEGVSAICVSVPPNVMAAFAPRKRVPVNVTVNGYPFRTTIADMGSGPKIGFNAVVRKGAGISAGETATIEVELDTAERTVTVPPDLTAAMTAADRALFDKLSYTHRREHVQAIEDAKKPETRERRIAKTIEMVRAKAKKG